MKPCFDLAVTALLSALSISYCFANEKPGSLPLEFSDGSPGFDHKLIDGRKKPAQEGKQEQDPKDDAQPDLGAMKLQLSIAGAGKPDQDLSDPIQTSQVLLMAGKSLIQIEDWKGAKKPLKMLLDDENMDADARIEAMYWTGLANEKIGGQTELREAYELFSKLSKQHDKSKWAPMADKRLKSDIYKEFK